MCNKTQNDLDNRKYHPHFHTHLLLELNFLLVGVCEVVNRTDLVKMCTPPSPPLLALVEL